jgi:hypothetical protein
MEFSLPGVPRLDRYYSPKARLLRSKKSHIAGEHGSECGAAGNPRTFAVRFLGGDQAGSLARNTAAEPISKGCRVCGYMRYTHVKLRYMHFSSQIGAHSIPWD